MMRAGMLLTLALIAADLAPARAATPPQRETSLIVYGDDPCPKGKDDEIVVCARQPEAERYRIPKRFRDKRDESTAVSWPARVASADEAARIGRPNSCSTVGSFGQTGCTTQMWREWREARRAMAAEAAAIP